jgi:hypothetical protein
LITLLIKKNVNGEVKPKRGRRLGQVAKKL